jgi:hypothetical protein
MGTPTLNIGQNLSPSQAIIVEAPGTPAIEVGQSLFPAQETISVVGGNPGSIVLEGVQGSITVTGQIPTFGAEILVKTGVSGHHFNMVLIGGAGPTITIPISNFSGRLSADLTSTLTVVIPSGADYVQPILDEIAFSGGAFKIEYIDIYVDGSKEYSYSEVFDIISLRQDRGSRSYSLTVRGSATLPTNLGRKIQLTDVSYIFSQTNGKTRVRSGYNSTILPGDLAVVDEPDISMNLAVASIYYAIGSQGITMEVSD